MPKVCRVGDLVSGPSGQGQAVTGSPTVSVENKKIVREGDTDNMPDGTHTFSSNNSTVFIENKKVVKVGDQDDRGNQVITGSPTVFIMS